ncbi:MAG: hypothetical protein BWY11_00940 [Firmicutes bacterium ADurb.Bin182]|nr:MAG: hypothetical protein BWY11_00940 [Firmicutes bacterium ADurb.Bin182]
MKITDFVRKHGIALVCCAATLSCGLILGVLIAPRKDMPADKTPAPEQLSGGIATEEPAAQNVSQSQDTAILPSAEVVWAVRFLKCDHVVEIAGQGDVTGLTGSQVAEKYTGFKVVSMTPESVQIERLIDSYCPSHLLLKTSGENKLSILQTDPDSFIVMQIDELSLDFQLLNADELSELQHGKVFDSKEKINAFIEDIES